MSYDYGKVETDVELKVSAAKFHDFFIKRPRHLTNISSDKIKDCNLIQGEWGTVGCIIGWNYVHDGKAKVVKKLYEAIDEENKSITQKVVEGDILEKYKSFKVITQATPRGDGCTVHYTFEYEKLHGGVEDPHTLVQFAVDLATDICSHLCSSA